MPDGPDPTWERDELRRSESRYRRAAEENAIMAEIGHAVGAPTEAEEVYRRFSEQVGRLIDFDRLAITLPNPGRATNVLEFLTGHRVGHWVRGFEFPSKGFIEENCLAERGPVTLFFDSESQVAAESPANLVAYKEGIRSMMAAPLIVEDRVVGVLSVASRGRAAYGEDAQNLFRKLANLIAPPVANSLLQDQLRSAEDAARRSEERLRSILDAAAEGIVTYDELGVVESTNAAAEAMFGLDRGEMAGRSIFDLLRLAAQTVASASALHLRAGRPLTGVRADGSEFPVDLSTSSFDVGGRTVFTGILRDATERERAQAATVRQATADARAEQLVESRRRMVKAQESLRRDIAQQLHGTVQNRMIVVANRLTQMARQRGADEGELTELSKIVIDLIDDDLRPMSHQLYPSILRRGLIPAVQTVAELVEPAKTLTLDLDRRLEREERSDRNRIPYDVRLGCYRVVEEAVTNILKHSSATEVHVTVAREGNTLAVWVEDNGQGFDAASAVESVGLAGMRDFAEMTGGSCRVMSSPGEGTRVSARFPLPAPTQ